ncbi:SIR2 family protein [Streptococcus iniae]|uniref:SIR2 family protein n=1 Tax=Streptococcus iniae TaxID=1346 RepID=UPI000EFB735B|nr:SIR2 family protein [Streptococcus iniae]RMI77107.1 SIR2 family protein [Streptococcus iniae]
MKRHYISSETTLSKENIEDKTLYYKNDDELKNDTNSSQENFSETDFKNEIKSNVSKFINKKFDNIVFLAGAGASVVTDAKGNIDSNFGKTVKIIADDIFKKLNEEQNLYSIQELAELTYFNRNENIIQIKDGKETLIDNFNLEDFLSNLLHFEPFVIDEKDKYITTKNRILTLIKNNTDYSYQSSILKHGAILKILTKRIEAPNKLSVVTTNYDTLFEGAAAAGNYTIFDGFNFLAEPQFDSDMFDWNLVREISNIKTKELEYSKRVFNLIKIHGSLTWERNSNGKIMRRRKQDISDIENTVMIFPSSDKYAQSYQEPYFELFSKFQELLKRSNTLLITTGFSFADNHISKMITQAVKNNKGFSLLVSDFNIEQESDNWIELFELMKDYHQIAFLKATLNDDLVEFLGGNYDD